MYYLKHLAAVIFLLNYSESQAGVIEEADVAGEKLRRRTGQIRRVCEL